MPTSATSVAKGDPVTLTATVGAKDNISGNNVTFTITNTATGSLQMVTADVNGTEARATWTPPAAGVYTITARYNGSSDSLPSMSQTLTYYAAAQKADASGTEPVYILRCV